MSALILDAGALIAVDRDNRRVVAQIQATSYNGGRLRTNPMVVAQVWRDPGGRQASLARFLRSVDIQEIAGEHGRRVGELLDRSRTGDPIDASVVLLASDGDSIMTSDPTDIAALVSAARLAVAIIPC